MTDAPPSPTALDLPPLDPLPERTAKYFAVCREKLGMVPNVLLAHAFSPEKLDAFSALYNELMLGESGLSKLEREMIAVVVSARNRCFLLPGGARGRGARAVGRPRPGRGDGLQLARGGSGAARARAPRLRREGDDIWDERGQPPHRGSEAFSRARRVLRAVVGPSMRVNIQRSRDIWDRGQRGRVLQHDQPHGQRHGHADPTPSTTPRPAEPGRGGPHQLSGPLSAKARTRKSMNARTLGWVNRPGG